ncbi:MAG TPA: NAD(P)/FAD-dependent oxidoreductase [Puia sp.]|jgi:cation diffusion facilitator CzcD-associated flavoprotein CzcO
MQPTTVLIVGASISGLAAAVCLKKKGLEFILIEKEAQIATPWRNHYDRLHLHTNKGLSAMPYKKFGAAIPRYPSRQQVVDYLEDYRKEFGIEPVFNTKALSIKREGGHWITETNNGTFQSKYVVMATGPFGKPKPVNFLGMESFPGKIVHSYGYKSGREFKGQKVLVVGFGNSGCEIAIDLYEQGAVPGMAVRSPVNIVPRDLLGIIPILRVSQLLSRFPVRLADKLSSRVSRLVFGDISKLGLRKMPIGVFEQFRREGVSPVLDIGTVKHIRDGHIRIHGGIDHIDGKTVYFSDGRTEDFDAIVAAIGYYRDYAEIVDVDKSRFEDLRVSVDRQKYFGKDGLYFCGFWIAPTGTIREIALDARKIARDITRDTRKMGTGFAISD